MSSARALSTDVSTMCEQPKNDDADDDYFAFADNNETDTSHMQTALLAQDNNKCDLEVLQYLEDKRKDLKVLQSYPIVQKVFIQYNVAMPSSAPVERLFSFAGVITRPHRRSMSDKIFEQLLLLTGNK